MKTASPRELTATSTYKTNKTGAKALHEGAALLNMDLPSGFSIRGSAVQIISSSSCMPKLSAQA
eukprot:CAMPEP_0117580668 /NCGR_PEP_ID=MMETSP0784-20121206/65348_1 /TAXON_ID=39447 /ORGANISM="" /LENGTH=63 /DNA_ID=CAMNT_0005380791 /DNA_START=869 /DNA_END=1060 /DNA_ORIENTATION=-